MGRKRRIREKAAARQAKRETTKLQNGERICKALAPNEVEALRAAGMIVEEVEVPTTGLVVLNGKQVRDAVVRMLPPEKMPTSSPRDAGIVTDQIDVRSAKPVSLGSDEHLAEKAGRVLIRWWKDGEHYGRMVFTGKNSRKQHPMKFDLRVFLMRDMILKGITLPQEFLKLGAGARSLTRADAEQHASEIGRSFQAWNNDARPARIQDTVQLPDLSLEEVDLDLRPLLNNVLRPVEEEYDRLGGFELVPATLMPQP